MAKRLGDNGAIIDINGWMARTTLEMLGQAGLGYSFDNFEDDSTDSYGESLKNFLYVPLVYILCFTVNNPASSPSQP